MILLASDLYCSSDGGIPVVNRLVAEAAQRGEIPGTIIALNDSRSSPWLMDWPGSFAAGGSRIRFLLASLARANEGRDSVVLTTHCGLVPVGRLAKHLARSKLVLLLLGVEVWRPLPARVRWGARGCDLLVAISRFTLGEFRKANPDLARIPATVCYLPARRLELEVDHKRLPQRFVSGVPRVAIVGRLWGRGLLKGQRRLIGIWPNVVSRVSGAELWIVGEGEGRRELEELARDIGIDRSVTFTGHVTDSELAAIYRSAKVFAMPSHGEGFGLVFAEAMSFGLPCIASRLDAGSEVVIHDETGLLVNPDDDGEILDAVVRLLSDTDLCRKLGAAGLERARGVFSLAGFDARMQAILTGRAPDSGARL